MQGVWSDAHTMLIGYIRDALGEELPDDLVARAEENVVLSHPGQPDPVWTPPGDDTGLAQRLADPVIVVMEEVTPRWVEIRSAKGKLVTVIEVTSPANKTRSGRAAFERKLQLLLDGGVNVMEIDLIHGGYGARDIQSTTWPDEPCQIVVRRAHRPRFAEVYPCPLRQSLPAVRVPLRQGEADAALDLQPLIDRCYERGRYWMLPYHEPPPAPLAEEDLAWAQEILQTNKDA